MEYPRLSTEQDRRKKLLDNDLKKIKNLRNLGYSYQKIANNIGVSKSIIRYHLNLKYKEKEKIRMETRDARRRKNLSWLAKYREIDKKSKKYRFSVNENYRKWNQEQCLKRYYKNKKTNENFNVKQIYKNILDMLGVCFNCFFNWYTVVTNFLFKKRWDKNQRDDC